MPQTSKPIFIHSAPRTSSTWFWARFRALPDALCFYEPFNEGQTWLTQDAIANIHHDSWDSRHPPLDPYYQEYAPLIGKPEGVTLFDSAMPFQWYIPVGGLRGTIRPAEGAYLSQFLQQGAQTGKTPVIGGWRTLGRVWAIKQALSGFHIFQYRNLWQQWLSFLSYKAIGDLTFYVTVMDTICRDDDPYFAYLVACGLTDAARSPRDPTLDPTVTWNRRYINVPRDETKVRALELMPEPHVFALFMGLHIYLYLHAQLCADLSADVTRMARDNAYRAGIEQAILQHTGLPVSFADAADGERPTDLPFDTSTIDWDTIREHAQVAVRMLRHLAEPAALTAEANVLIDATIAEIRRHEAPITRSNRTTITLCMIVKNEAPVIRRCLDSVRPLIDHWVIVDTGSTDGTQDIIRKHLHDLPGTLHERPWRDFAHNRSEALVLARDKADYTLIIDADDTLQIAPGAAMPELTADSYTLELDDSGIVYQRTQLVRSAQSWRYEGVLHEFLTCDGAGPAGHISQIRMRRNHDGARRKDPHTYRRDAEVLETALQTETRDFLIARYRFYLAQSYRDCGQREQALENYLRRADLGFWQEEVFVSLYEAAKLKEALAHPEQDIIDTYLRASDALPTRAEALHGAARFCRYKGRNAEGYEIARRGLDLPLRTDALFVEPWIYETGLLDEYAINAYWSGHYHECLDASLKILATGKPTGTEMKRITANARFAAERLPQVPPPPNLGTFATEGFIEQHKLTKARLLHTRLDNPPRVLIAILAKQKEPCLPLYLECIEALDYPKSSIVLYIRTNNNTDRTETILREWVARVGHLYADVEFDAHDVVQCVEQFGVHEWNATRFRVLGHIRNVSLRRALEFDCDFYFVADVDNFIRPCTLRELVALNLPIVAPMLRSVTPGNFYSNYHAEIDANGYYRECDQYHWILNRNVRGIIELPLVHCTYLIRADVLNDLTYQDATDRFEYVVFSDSARRAGVPQYYDNRQIYGYISFDPGGILHTPEGMNDAAVLLAADLKEAAQRSPSDDQETKH